MRLFILHYRGKNLPVFFWISPRTDTGHCIQAIRGSSFIANFVMLRYFLLWLPMLIIAIGNGLLREAVIKQHFSDAAAHQLSTVSLLLFFSVYIGFVIYRFPPANASQALMIGLSWLLMTLAFEFGFGWWRGNTWPAMLGEYNIFNGKLWILVPLWVAVAPYLFFQWLK